MVNAILGLCPKIKTIQAEDAVILLEKKQGLTINENVQTIKLRTTKFGLSGLASGGDEDKIRTNGVLSTYGHFKRFPKLHELVLHNLGFTLVRNEDGNASKQSFRDFDFRRVLIMPDVTAASLRRLVFSDSAPNSRGRDVSVALQRMENLECLYLEGSLAHLSACDNVDLPQLREFCAINVGVSFKQLAKKVVANKFPKLEDLILTSDDCVDTESLSQLLTVNLALRILVIAGGNWKLKSQRQRLDFEQQLGIAVPLPMPAVQLPVTLPARKLLAVSNAENQSRLPLLQIFVGGDFTKHVRFTLPPPDVAKFWRIDCPMPEYLAKSEVAEIFKEVFVAKIIREGPGNGPMRWGHPDNLELFFSAQPLLLC